MGNTQNEEKHVRIPVKALPVLHDVPVYNDLRELLDGSTEKYGSKDAFIIKTKRATKSTAAE